MPTKPPASFVIRRNDCWAPKTPPTPLPTFFASRPASNGASKTRRKPPAIRARPCRNGPGGPIRNRFQGWSRIGARPPENFVLNGRRLHGHHGRPGSRDRHGHQGSSIPRRSLSGNHAAQHERRHQHHRRRRSFVLIRCPLPYPLRQQFRAVAHRKVIPPFTTLCCAFGKISF